MYFKITYLCKKKLHVKKCNINYKQCILKLHIYVEQKKLHKNVK